MKDWIVDECYLYLEIISRRPSIIWVPVILMVLGLILIAYLNSMLANYLTVNSEALSKGVVEHVYEKQLHRAEFFAFILPFVEFLRRYWKARKSYR